METTFLNGFCKIEDERHTARCSEGGGSSYDPLSGVSLYGCRKKAHWHLPSPSHGVVCKNLCLDHARLFKKAGLQIEPYPFLVDSWEKTFVTRSPFSRKGLLLTAAGIGYIAYSILH